MRRLLLSVGAAVLLLAGFLLVLGPARLASQLAEADIGLFALGLIAVLGALVCWGEATRRLFGAFGAPLSRRRALIAYGAGAFGKQILPMGNAGGPAVMGYVYDREVSVGYSRSLAVVIVAEFLSLVASLVLGIVGIAVLLLFGAGNPSLRWLGVGVVVLAALLTGLAIVVWYRRRYVTLAVTGIARLLQPVAARISPSLAERLRADYVSANLQHYYETVDVVVGDRRAVLYAFAFSQLGWVLFALPLYTAARALGVTLPLSVVLFLVPAAGLATVVPLPGGLGGVEVALAGLLTAVVGLELTTAGAVVILYRLCSFWFFVLVCGIATSMAAVSVRELHVPLEQSSSHPESTNNHRSSLDHEAE